jgi:hypothetical protein
MELWAVHKYYTYLQKSNQKKKAWNSILCQM